MAIIKSDHWIFRSSLLFLAVVSAVIAGVLSCSDNPANPPNITRPDITAFTVNGVDSVDVGIGTSVTIAYTILRADSVKLFPPGQRLPGLTSDTFDIVPTASGLYVLRAYNAAGHDADTVTIAMSSAIPLFTRLDAPDSVMAPGDSIAVSWAVLRADSVKMIGGGRLNPTSGGAIYLKPTVSTLYAFVAYNAYGTDTATIGLTVEIAHSVQPVSGLFFKGAMGSDATDQPIRFQVVDEFTNVLRKIWLKFELIEGDGTLSADSLLPAPSGWIDIKYTFSGTLGHARIRALVEGVDTLEVLVRANTIIPGEDFQGQYVRRGDTYATVSGFNGTPRSIDDVTNFWVKIANYEIDLGAVFVFEDVDRDNILDPSDVLNETILDSSAIILNTVYSGTTAEGIGIGSELWEIRNVYGSPTYAVNDPADTLVVYYDTQGLIFFCGTNPTTTNDTVVAEIHLRSPR